MPLNHTKEFGVYQLQTALIIEADTIEEADKKIKEYYGDRIKDDGADQVRVVDSDGNVIKSYNVG